MGSASSCKSGGAGRAGEPGLPGLLAPTGVLPTRPPYCSHPVIYRHIVIKSTINKISQLRVIESDVNMSSNVEQYYPQLAAMYDQGYRMLVFALHPGTSRCYGLPGIGKAQSVLRFHGIFRRLFPGEESRQWELRVENPGSMFMSSDRTMGSTTDNSKLFKTLQRISTAGGRLVNVELTGEAGKQLVIQRPFRLGQVDDLYTQFLMNSTKMLDVFYELPRSGSGGQRYMYQIVPCLMESKPSKGRWVSKIPWETVMRQYLITGWKLVEIFEDYSSSINYNNQQMFSMKITMQKNFLWIFEKAVSRRDDPTPLYEGTMVEHWCTITRKEHAMGLGGWSTNVATNWEPLLDHSGHSGWQLVRIIDTPDTQIEGIFHPIIHQRQMIFLQRLIGNRRTRLSNTFGLPRDATQSTDEV
ncbi:hypothetical protein MAR_010804 [Mya arenaria]|uniref:Uncharacterized protein n=1 Tax=Mya arenaria TaxID=6604 RepID=A0ABY7FSA1_MYAAR|nr:hypothetical protein MAR_010804 [Mya arenaria]